ncbi:glycerophosphodiester phosphodiesterase family protein [Geomicrobium sp. JCM 19037]|uniref:glycerophosphodiester phosphodiesterase family protein n=1 Tax=Geomicrobium sp. JCM 19037 TaxID=1460634 RepID=UPI000694C618
MKERAANVHIGLLLNSRIVKIENYLRSFQPYSVYSVHPHFRTIQAEDVLDFKSNNLKVFPYTVNEQSDLSAMKQFGVDGIISDSIMGES